MSSRMLKYLIMPADHFGEFKVEMPESATIKHIALQDSPYGLGIMAWCEVINNDFWCDVINNDFKRNRRYILIATGGLTPDNGEYLKTVEYPSGTIWHLYRLF